MNVNQKMLQTRRPENVEEFIRVLEESLPSPTKSSAAQRWEYLRNTIDNAASLTFGKSKQRKQTVLRPTWTRYKLSLKRRGVPLPPTEVHPVRGCSIYLWQPEIKSNMFQGVVQMTSLSNCAITYMVALTQAILRACMME